MDDEFARKAFSGAMDELAKAEKEWIDKHADSGVILDILMIAAEEVGIEKMYDMVQTLGDKHHDTFTKYVSAVAYMSIQLGYESKLMEEQE